MVESIPPFSVIVAATAQNGIGKGNNLPWRLPTDMQFFKTVTSTFNNNNNNNTHSNVVIMGRKTWESIPERFRPLDGRVNAILSRDKEYAVKNNLPSSVKVYTSLSECLTSLATATQECGHIFIIGGGQIYAEALQHPSCKTVFLTRVHQKFDCDTFFPDLNELNGWERASEERLKILLKGILEDSNNTNNVDIKKKNVFKLGVQTEKSGIPFEFTVYERA